MQNVCAYRGRSRIGQVAAVDGASRIGMFSGARWPRVGVLCLRSHGASRVPDAARVPRAAAHAQVAVARAVADLELHSGLRTLDDTAAFYREQALMSAEAAESKR